MTEPTRPPEAVYSLKSAAEAFQIPLPELRQALSRGELKMARVWVEDWRLTHSGVSAWVALRAAGQTASGYFQTDADRKDPSAKWARLGDDDDTPGGAR